MTEEKKGFVIKDRRIFSQEAQEVKEEVAKEEPRAETAADKTAEEPGKEETPRPGASEGSPPGAEKPMPEINFATFLFSLNSSALVHLGVIEDPVSGQKQKSLPLAKQTIDIIGMLEERTRGNLEEDEENLLKNILHDLRLMYVRERN